MATNDDANADISTVSAADRIRELNEIDIDIARIPEYLSKAVSVLADVTSSSKSLDDQKAAFSEANAAYLSTLDSVETRLRRQIYGLEEAGLIPIGDSKRDAAKARVLGDDELSRRHGGGPLDTSWLNARARDTVGATMKKENLEDTKQFLQSHAIDVQTKDSSHAMDIDTKKD